MCPGQCRNFCFGGPDRDLLYLRARTSIVKDQTQGAEFFK